MGFLTYAAYSSVRHSYRQYSAEIRASQRSAERRREQEIRREKKFYWERLSSPRPPQPPPKEVIYYLQLKQLGAFTRRKRDLYQSQIDHIKAGGEYHVSGSLILHNASVLLLGTPPPPPLLPRSARSLQKARARARAKERARERGRTMPPDEVVAHLQRQAADPRADPDAALRDLAAAAHIMSGGRYVSGRIRPDGTLPVFMIGSRNPSPC